MQKELPTARHRFGGNREAAILRDGEKCVDCGMTRAEHKARWGRDITVDHIDRKGRYTPTKERNNNLNNLKTLCLKCHGAKDGKQQVGKGYSKIVGVSYAKNNKRWQAHIRKDGHLNYLGYFKTEMEAAQARWDAEKTLNGGIY